MKKFFALIVTAVTLFSIVAAPLAGAAPFLTDSNGLTAGTRDAQTLDEALNVEGGELTFFNGDSDNALDWSIDIDAAKSSNRDLDNSKSNVSTTVFAQAGQILEFSYRVMSQQDCDFLIFYSNGQEIARWSGIMNYYAPLEKFVFPIPSSGEYTFSWVYEKDGQYSESWDTAWLDEVRVFDMVHVESIIVDEPREIPENGKYKLKYTVLPENATEKGLLSGKSVENSMSEFALGKAAMVQNGNWAWDQISKVSGNTVKADDIKYLPIYIGVDGEEKQGLCIGTENYLAINKNASEEKQKASVEFLEWLFSSDTGKDYVVNKLKFISPFNTFKDNEKPDDPLAKEILKWMESDKTTVEWVFNSFPGLDFKDSVGSVLLEYVQGSKTWDDVKKTTVDSWAAAKS